MEYRNLDGMNNSTRATVNEYQRTCFANSPASDAFCENLGAAGRKESVDGSILLVGLTSRTLFRVKDAIRCSRSLRGLQVSVVTDLERESWPAEPPICVIVN